MLQTGWKVIGTILGLPSGELKAIEPGYPTNVKWCCNQMLEMWLEMDPTASWGKLFTVIESPAVSTGQASDKGGVDNYWIVNICSVGRACISPRKFITYNGEHSFLFCSYKFIK